jgi:hypothetical protein
MECFASPLNCRYKNYCSLFPDTDAPFGSVGNFFDFSPQQGCYQAMPPTVESVVLASAQRINQVLNEVKKEALAFVMFIRSPERVTAGVRALEASPFLVKTLLVKARAHGFCSGFMHCHSTRYLVSTTDTAVYFLQNAPARGKWKVTPQVCEELLAAMASQREQEQQERVTTLEVQRVGLQTLGWLKDANYKLAASSTVASLLAPRKKRKRTPLQLPGQKPIGMLLFIRECAI